VRIGDLLLFGYNVFIGLKKETAVGDVFALYRLAEADGGDELEAVPLAGSFLADPRFAADFRELYAYYKQARLLQLRVTQDKLLAAFQIGQQLHDLRVFRWSIEPGGEVRYIDNRGERDIALPPPPRLRVDAGHPRGHVGGRHPHINILDTVFVETVGGDLTVKIENNTETGLGIYSEPVEDKQPVAGRRRDRLRPARLLILLRVKPYREQARATWSTTPAPEGGAHRRHRRLLRAAARGPRHHLPRRLLPAIRRAQALRPAEAMLGTCASSACCARPTARTCSTSSTSPASGHYALFTYNLIDKTLGAPMSRPRLRASPTAASWCSGRERRADPVHPMQVWQTPFCSEEHAAAGRRHQGFFGRIGNAELVRGISDLMGIARAVREQVPTRTAYEDLIRQCGRVPRTPISGYPKPRPVASADRAAGDRRRRPPDPGRIREGRQHPPRDGAGAAAGRRRAARPADRHRQHAVAQAGRLRQALGPLRERRGRLQPLRSCATPTCRASRPWTRRWRAEQQRVGERAMPSWPTAGLRRPPQALVQAGGHPQASTSPALEQAAGELDAVAAGLDLLTEQLGSLPGGDAVVRTASSTASRRSTPTSTACAPRPATAAARAWARRGRGRVRRPVQAVRPGVENALEFADTPEKCDEALTRLLAQLEELEGRFAEQDNFLADIASQARSRL
jgi:hypothetical protein